MKATTKQKTASTVPAGAKQGAEARDWSWVEASVWTERMVSALVNGVEGGKWYSLMDKVYAPKTLALAWERVRANKGAAGVDGQSVERFAAGAETYLAELSRELREGSYRRQPVKRVDIPKGDGKTRPLGIPTVKDRIVQRAVKLVIEPVFEAEFCPGSYGFRPGRSCKEALREVDGLLKAGYAFVVDACQEWFIPGTETDRVQLADPGSRRPSIVSPPDGVIIALDPDIPADKQLVLFSTGGLSDAILVLDGKTMGSAGGALKWQSAPGKHTLALQAPDGRLYDHVYFTVRGLRPGYAYRNP